MEVACRLRSDHRTCDCVQPWHRRIARHRQLDRQVLSGCRRLCPCG